MVSFLASKVMIMLLALLLSIIVRSLWFYRIIYLYFQLSVPENFVFFAVFGKNVKRGSFVNAMVIDISEGEGLVDLSLKPELISSVFEKGAKKSSANKVPCDLSLSCIFHQLVAT